MPNILISLFLKRISTLNSNMTDWILCFADILPELKITYQNPEFLILLIQVNYILLSKIS